MLRKCGCNEGEYKSRIWEEKVMEEHTMPDGSIWYRCVTEKFEPGILVRFGNEKTYWRVLEVDNEASTAVLILEKPG